ncbi:MAG: slipin family protein [Candidatus Omnitrophica bacterium]|nr:slipin family protein [Candidatus Omnitrophota bacterium]
MPFGWIFSPLGIVFLVVLYAVSCIKILKEYERGVIFTLGRLQSTPKGPGLILVFNPIQQMVKISLRTVVLDVPPQDVITRDNVSIKVNAVIYFRAIDPNKAVTEVEDYFVATSQMSQTTLRSVLGQVELDDLLAEREKLNLKLQEIIDKHTDPWGVKVSAVEVKHVDLPEEMRRAMAKQAEAEREKRAKIIGAEAEFQSAEKLVEAAKMMGNHPIALQLRYLQTLAEVATENNSTTLFPIPIDLLKPFLEKKKGEG